MYDLIVIGAGPGGYEAAAHGAKLGKRVALVEKGALGGTCLNVGCIPTKTLLRSVKTLEECRNAAAYGVSLEGAPSLQLSAVQARKEKVIATLVQGVAALEKRLGVEVISGTARLIAPGKVQVGERILEAEHLLLATGSVPAMPPIPGLRENPLVMDSTGALSVEKIPERLTIIGGGVIGLEFASFFSACGSKVSVIEMLPRIAPPVDGEIAKRLMVELKRRGVVFYLSCKVLRINGANLYYADAAGAEHILEGDRVLAAIGRSPVLQNLGLEECGVAFDRKGIRTDAAGRTSVPGIWACGDCTGRCLLAHAATREGIVAVNNMFGHPDEMRYDAVPSVIYTHPEVAQVGATEERLQAEGIAYRKISLPMGSAGRFLVDYAGQSGSVKVLVGAEDGRILGVHMIGGCCGEFIAAAAEMVEKHHTMSEMASVIFPHPTNSEILKIALS